jgi:hypothetical protein
MERLNAALMALGNLGNRNAKRRRTGNKRANLSRLPRARKSPLLSGLVGQNGKQHGGAAQSRHLIKITDSKGTRKRLLCLKKKSTDPEDAKNEAASHS